jgi:hypothetical protein
MTDQQRLLELIQADLDGQLDGAGKAELARLLLADPAARRLQEELRQTDALLRDLPRAPPPDDLRSAVQEALGLPDHDRGGRRVADGGVGFRLAAAVVAGLVVVGLGYGLLSDRQDTAALQGSVAEAARPAAILQAGQGEVSARLAPSKDGMRLTLEASGGATGDVVLDYDPARIACRSTDGSAALSSPATGQWVLSLPASSQSVTLVCSGEGPVQLESRSSGDRLAEATIQLPP